MQVYSLLSAVHPCSNGSCSTCPPRPLGPSLHPQVLLCRAVTEPVGLQPMLLPGVIPCHLQDFAFGFVELHKVCVVPFSSLSGSLWTAARPCNIFSSLSLFSHHPQTYWECSPVVVQVVNDCVELSWPLYWPPKDATGGDKLQGRTGAEVRLTGLWFLNSVLQRVTL